MSKSKSKAPKVFSSKQFGKVRAKMNADKQPIICLYDLCRNVRLQVCRIVKQLPKEHVTLDTCDNGTSQRMAYYVTVDGMNELFAETKNRGQNYDEFHDWLTRVVIPTLLNGGKMPLPPAPTPTPKPSANSKDEAILNAAKMFYNYSSGIEFFHGMMRNLFLQEIIRESIDEGKVSALEMAEAYDFIEDLFVALRYEKRNQFEGRFQAHAHACQGLEGGEP